MSSTIQVRVDEELKMRADQLFKDLGTDTTSAIRIFLTQAIAHDGFPFEIKRKVSSADLFAALSEDELLEKLDVAREHSLQGRYREAGVVASDMRSKYGL